MSHCITLYYTLLNGVSLLLDLSLSGTASAGSFGSFLFEGIVCRNCSRSKVFFTRSTTVVSVACRYSFCFAKICSIAFNNYMKANRCGNSFSSESSWVLL